MAREGSLSKDMLTETTLEHLKALHTIAGERKQELAQMALAWVLRDERMTSTLIGASSVAQLEANLGALQNLDFSDDELARIDQHAKDAGINLWAESTQH